MNARVTWAAALIFAALAAPAPAVAQSAGRPARATTAQWERVRRLADAHRWEAALTLAEKLADDSAGRVAVARLAANAGIEAFESGDTTRARRHWELAVRDDPGLAPAAANLAQLLLVTGAVDSARAVVGRALRVAPTDPTLLAVRQRTLTSRPAIDSAIQADQALRRRHPSSDGVALDLAGLLLRSGQGLAAAALYDSLVAVPAPSEAVYSAVTQFLLAVRRYPNAATLADTAVAHYPRSATLWTLAAAADSADTLWRAAATAYRHAAELVREPGLLELHLIHAEAKAGDTATAVDVLRAMLARPAPRGVLLEAAGAVEALGAVRVADSVYRAVLARAPEDVTALDASAAIAERAGDTARAVSLYRREAAVDSGGPEAPLALLRLTQPPADSAHDLLLLAEWRGLSQLQWAQAATVAELSSGRPPLAVRRTRSLQDIVRAILDTVVFHTRWGPDELAKAQRAYPGSPLLESYAARLAARRGQDSVALADYDALLRADAGEVDFQRERAAVLDHMGRQGDAARGYARAFELDPANDSTYRILVRLDEQIGGLGDLLAQVRRLRTRYPKLRVLTEHEIEILQRLGRLEEASAVADSLKDGHS